MYASVLSTINGSGRYYYQLVEPRPHCTTTGTCTCELYLKQWNPELNTFRLTLQDKVIDSPIDAYTIYIFPCNVSVKHHGINETCEARDNCFLNIDSTGCIIETPTQVTERHGGLYNLCAIPIIVPQIPTPESSYITELMDILVPHNIEEQK